MLWLVDTCAARSLRRWCRADHRPGYTQWCGRRKHVSGASGYLSMDTSVA